MRTVILNPTLACGNCLNFEKDLDILIDTGIEMLHIDIMDGHYVPNLCFSPDIIRELKKKYPFQIDVHLMVTDPGAYIEQMKDCGADLLSFHLNASPFSIRMLRLIRRNGMKAGIVLNPAEPVGLLEEVLEETDFILVMGVEPGFSGQRFLPNTTAKVAKLDALRKQHGYQYQIEADGGIGDEELRRLKAAGADILVSGAFGVFRRSGRGLREDCLNTKKILEEG